MGVAVPEQLQTELDVDVVVVGAGFSGLYMLHKLREMGLTACVFERGSGVGGSGFQRPLHEVTPVAPAAVAEVSHRSLPRLRVPARPRGSTHVMHANRSPHRW